MQLKSSSKYLFLCLFFSLVLVLIIIGPSFLPGAEIELEPGQTVLDAYLDQAVGEAVQSQLGGGGGTGGSNGGGTGGSNGGGAVGGGTGGGGSVGGGGGSEVGPDEGGVGE